MTYLLTYLLMYLLTYLLKYLLPNVRRLGESSLVSSWLTECSARMIGGLARDKSRGALSVRERTALRKGHTRSLDRAVAPPSESAPQPLWGHSGDACAGGLVRALYFPSTSRCTASAVRHRRGDLKSASTPRDPGPGPRVPTGAAARLACTGRTYKRTCQRTY